MLLAHLILFGFIYPSARSRVPEPGIMQRAARTGCAPELGAPDADDPVCYGTLLSWSQYLGDVFGGNFRDARIRPFGSLTRRRGGALDLGGQEVGRAGTAGH